jgi:hypothetical protein
MSIKLIIGLLIIIAIAVGASFYTSASDQSAKGNLLAQKNNNDTQNLLTISNKTRDVEAEITGISKDITTAKATLNAIKVELPEMVNSNIIVKKIIDFGDKTAVTVILRGTKDWASLSIDKHDYHVFKMSIEVNGPQQNVIDYTKQVQDSVDQYLIIERLEMSKIKDQQTTTGPGGPATRVNLDIALYAR